MLTVILLSEHARGLIQGCEGLFAPFEDSSADGIAFAQWNESPSAKTRAEALPDLSDVIRGKREWRALVVDGGGKWPQGPHAARDDNPFDFVDRAPRLNGDGLRVDHELTESPHPLVRLGHILLGYPEMGPRDFETMITFRRAFADDPVTLPVDPESLEGGVRPGGGEQPRYDVRIHFAEVPYSEEARQRHAELSSRYAMGEVRPTEVIYVATRRPADADEMAALRQAWHIDTSSEPSRFVERNDYPPSSRFAVFDLVDPRHSEYPVEVRKFWLSVLTLAINHVPPSSLQAERLYQLGVDVDEPAWGRLLNDHLSRLAAIRDHIDARVRKPPRPQDQQIQELLTPRKVHVEFDGLRGDELRVPTTGFRLASESAQRDLSRWAQVLAGLEARAGEVIRQPKRELARAVRAARDEARTGSVGDPELSQHDQLELAEELRKRMQNLTEPATMDILDPDRLRGLIRRNDESVRQALEERMARGTLWLTTAVVLGAWTIALLPYLVQAFGRGWVPLVDSLVVVLTLSAVLMAAGVLVLVALRVRVRRRLEAFNQALMQFIHGVNQGAAQFGEYLTNLTTYTYARRVLVDAQRRERLQTRRRDRLTDYRALVSEAIEHEKTLLQALGVPAVVERSRDGLISFEEDNEAGTRSVLRWPVGDSPARFNDAGVQVKAPYDFVTALHVVRCAVDEPALESRPKADDAHGDSVPRLGG